MRPTREQARENKQRILDTAARLFRENGIHAVGVDAVMKGAGLTHGGFYGHFKSKNDLTAQALSHTMEEKLRTPAQTLEAFVGDYLSTQHRDASGDGCAVAALGAELARFTAGERGSISHYVEARITQMQEMLREAGRPAERDKAIADLASLVGALIMARAVDDKALSDEILRGATRSLTADRAAF